MDWGELALKFGEKALLPALGVVVGGLLLRMRERVTWQESAKGHLAKTRHDALASALSALSKLYDATVAFQQRPPFADDDVSYEGHVRECMELRGAVAAHLFLLPPEIRRAAEVLLERLSKNPFNGNDNRAAADEFAKAVEPFMPELKRR